MSADQVENGLFGLVVGVGVALLLRRGGWRPHFSLPLNVLAGIAVVALVAARYTAAAFGLAVGWLLLSVLFRLWRRPSV